MLIKCYTDGACSGNPGPGGYGGVICLPNELLFVKGFEKQTTNNRMELMAVTETIKNLMDMIFQEKIKNVEKLEIISDSAYVVNVVNGKWLQKWNINGFKTRDGKPVKNIDLWIDLITKFESLDFIGVEVVFTKIKGHNGDAFNEKADELARSQIKLNLGGSE